MTWVLGALNNDWWGARLWSLMGCSRSKAGELAGPSSLHHTFVGKHVLQQMAMAILEASVLAVLK